MRIFISDTFYDKLFKLNPTIQMKVLNFQRKFRENPKSPGLNLEKINKNNSNTMWSARVDNTYRVIIGILPGDIYNLVYIDHHDEAYEWANKRNIVWNENTDAFQLVKLVEVEQQIPIASIPSTSSGILANISPEQLLKIGVPEDMISQVMVLKDIDELGNIENDLPSDAFENLFNLFDGADITEFIRTIEEGKAASGTDALLSANNKGRFIEITNDEQLAEIIDQGMDKWQLFLHPSQRKIVEQQNKGSFKVSGGAGTGKTVAALHRLLFLSKNPNANILYTTYTKALKGNLITLAKKLNVPQNKYSLDNIDSVMIDLAKRYHLTDGYSIMDIFGGDDKSKALWNEVTMTHECEFRPDFLFDEYIDVIVYNNNKEEKDYLRQSRIGRTKAITRKQKRDIWKLKEVYERLKKERKVIDRLELYNRLSNYLNDNNIHPFTNVIVDEFQDFSNPELRFIRALVAEGENDLFIVGDPYQRIYLGRRLNFGAAGINIRGNRSRKLKVNYRTTEEIKKVAVSVVKGQSFDDMDGGEESQKGYVSLMHGDKPIYKMVDNPGEEIETVLEYINKCTKSGIPAKDICVTAYSLGWLKDLQTKLHIQGNDPKIWKDGRFIGNDEGVRFCTLHSIKGLEFRVVIVMGVSERNLPSVVSAAYPFPTLDKAEKHEYLMQIRSLIYVAITRAREFVFLTGYGERCGLLNKL